LAKKEQNNSYNGLDGNKVLIPYSAMARHFPDPRPFIGPGHIDNLLIVPVTPDDHLKAVKQVRRLLGRRHGFEPADEGAIWCWDTVQMAQMVSHIYDSMELFLSFMAFITLGLGGIGVMNIMLVSVAERTREIGVKQAVGATPGRILFEFFLEAVTLTVLSGLAGLVVAWAICSAVSRLPLPALFAGLPVSSKTALIAFSTLVLVGILSALYPARRASLLVPVEALRYE
jgi:putative ABC transport system permease protein